ASMPVRSAASVCHLAPWSSWRTAAWVSWRWLSAAVAGAAARRPARIATAPKASRRGGERDCRPRRSFRDGFESAEPPSRTMKRSAAENVPCPGARTFRAARPHRSAAGRPAQRSSRAFAHEPPLARLLVRHPVADVVDALEGGNDLLVVGHHDDRGLELR